jgi:hypothetical protein
MVDQDEHEHRESLLAFLEAHWGSLTLREACSLALDGVRASSDGHLGPFVKDALMSP